MPSCKYLIFRNNCELHEEIFIKAVENKVTSKFTFGAKKNWNACIVFHNMHFPRTSSEPSHAWISEWASYFFFTKLKLYFNFIFCEFAEVSYYFQEVYFLEANFSWIMQVREAFPVPYLCHHNTAPWTVHQM